MNTEALNPAVNVGDMIEVGYRHRDSEYWHHRAYVVREVDANGTPYVRYRFGKVNKPAQLWRIPKPSERIRWTPPPF